MKSGYKEFLTTKIYLSKLLYSINLLKIKYDLRTLSEHLFLCVGSRYGECIQNSLEQRLDSWLGCIPPWFPTQSKEKTM